MPLTPSHNRPAPPRRVVHAGGPVLACFLLALLPGCKKHSPGDGHDHGDTSAAAPHDHDHDHQHADEHAGHDHGEAEHADEVHLTADAVERYGIKVDSAQSRVLHPTLTAPARVAFNAEAMAHVGTPLRGRVVEVKARVGDAVMAGQDLFIIESPELGEAQADLLQKHAAARAAGPTTDLAKAAWDRAKGLYEQSQGISLTDVQRREGDYKAAAAAQKAAEAAALASESRLRLLGMTPPEVTALTTSSQIAPRHAIKAAIGGTVIQREVTLGELVGPDRDSLLVLADMQTLWVLADVPEAALAGVSPGAKAWITIGPLSPTSDLSPPAHKFEGTVAFIAPQVDPATRTAQVRIEVPATTDRGLTLRPGMFAQAEIVQSIGDADPAPTVAVPDEAIQTVEGGPAVFVPVAGEPNTYVKRAVTIGKPIGGLVPISAGLAEGEPFVIAGTFILKAELGKGSAAHEH